MVNDGTMNLVIIIWVEKNNQTIGDNHAKAREDVAKFGIVRSSANIVGGNVILAAYNVAITPLTMIVEISHGLKDAYQERSLRPLIDGRPGLFLNN